MSWEVTIVNAQDSSSDVDNKIPKLDPEISVRGRWLPVNSNCNDAAYTPEVSFAEFNGLDSLGFKPEQPWGDIFPEGIFSGSGNASNLILGDPNNKTVISTYEYEIDDITAEIEVNGVVEKSTGKKYECAIALASQAVAGVKTDQKNNSDLVKIFQHIKSGAPITNGADGRVSTVMELHGEAGSRTFKSGDPESPSTDYSGLGGSALKTDSEIYGAGYPVDPVNRFQDWDNDYAEISWTDGYHHYQIDETYTMQDVNGNTITKPITWVDFDIYMGARIAWNADLFDHTFPNPNYEPFGYGYSEKLSERPGFVKVELGEVWEGEGYDGDTGGRQHGPDDPRWPFIYGYGELGATMNTLKVYVPRARCLGLWKDVLNININAGWCTDTVFDEPVSLPRELKVVYKGTTKTKMITPPGYLADDYNWQYWAPTDSVATITFNEDGTFEIYN